jgi:branched-chain amino acid transport system substrate-binding protein
VRIQRTTACLCIALALLAAGCGSTATTTTTSDPIGGTRTLAIESDLPLDGPSALNMGSVVDGELLALHEVDWHVGEWRVQFRPEDDTDSSTGVWSPSVTAQAAHATAANPEVVGYIGDWDSGATATSLQETNATGTLQVSPWSPYVGFTDQSPAADKGDPARFQAGGQSTFARLVPSDAVQARASVRYMRALGVTRLYVLGDVSDPFDADIAQLVANDAPKAGIYVVGDQAIDTGTNTQPAGYSAYATAAAQQRADGVLFAGAPSPGASALLSEINQTLPHAKLFLPSTLATPDFLATLGTTATAATYVTSPILSLGQYPKRARRVLAAYRRRFGVAPTTYALYGYEAMRDVLNAIKRAGAKAGNRAALLRAFFHLGPIHGVIGDYTIDGHGDSSLRAMDGYRVSASGQLIDPRPIPVGP